jgi:hypothetical protein
MARPAMAIRGSRLVVQAVMQPQKKISSSDIGFMERAFT